MKYYNKNADNFAKTTIDVNFYETQKHFQTLLTEHAREMAKAFSERGIHL
ncbi:hypothetical protein [Agathobacter sp.]